MILFLAAGLAAGTLIGMMGIGGGIFFVPLLYFILPYTNIAQSQISYIVIGTSLFSAAVATISSGANHLRSKNVDKRKTIWLAAGSMLSAFLSVFLVVQTKPLYLRIFLAVVFILIAFKMLFENRNKSARSGNTPQKMPDFLLFIFGAGTGIFSAYAGLGGGIIYVPLLSYLFGLNIKRAIGTSAAVIAFTTFAASISYAVQTPLTSAAYQIGYVYLIAGIPLGAGSAIGAFKGVKLSLGASPEKLRKIFSVLIILAVLKILLNF